MNDEEAADSLAEFGEQMNQCSMALVNACTTRLATNASDIANFVTESQSILKDTSISLSTKSKKTVIAACGACVNFAAESANFMRRAGSAVGGWVRGFFSSCVAPAVPPAEFDRVVAAAAAQHVSGSVSVARVADEVARVADEVAAAAAASSSSAPFNQESVNVQLEMAAIAESSLRNAQSSLQNAEGGAGDHRDRMGSGGSRSRKRSASKRTRRHKGVAKKQKSKKNKRQSRRKARRSSSRKAGRN
jgi:hypothetical protein